MPDKSSLQDLPSKGTLTAKMDDNTEAHCTDMREKYDFHCANIIRGKIVQESQDTMEKRGSQENNANNCKQC